MSPVRIASRSLSEAMTLFEAQEKQLAAAEKRAATLDDQLADALDEIETLRSRVRELETLAAKGAA